MGLGRLFNREDRSTGAGATIDTESVRKGFKSVRGKDRAGRESKSLSERAGLFKDTLQAREDEKFRTEDERRRRQLLLQSGGLESLSLQTTGRKQLLGQ